MTTENFVIYRSSAGSGKTYTLAREYLIQALRSDFNFKHVLAVTFTNKATQEMKSRILEFLKDISLGQEKGLAEVIASELEISLSEVEKRAGRVLSNILHNYSNFYIKTIDSFFQDIIKSFTKELGLQGSVSIELDQNKVMSEVTDSLLAGLENDKKLSKWLVRFSTKNIEDGKNWDPTLAIENFGNELLKESFKVFEKEIIAMEEEHGKLDEFIKELYVIINEFRANCKRIGKAALQILGDLGLTPEDFSYSKASFASKFSKLTEEDTEKPSSRFVDAHDNLEKWATKSCSIAKKDLIEKAFYHGLNDLVGETLTFFEKDYQAYLSAVHTQKYLYCFGIINKLIAALEEHRKENDIMLISDATVFLKQIIQENDAPFIYEKIGTQFQHYLIDEFQDTSGFQWDNFFPLIENSLSQGFEKEDGTMETYKNLIVGDVKQSIYRWRGGDLQLLQEQVEQDVGTHSVSIQQLDTNWRSKKNVIDFNNEVFGNVADYFIKQFEQEHFKTIDEGLKQKVQSELAIVKNAYADVFQKFPKHKENDKNKGHVKINFIKKEKEIKLDDQILAELPETIEELQENGYTASDIAFLTRNKAEGVKIASFFMNYKTTDEAKENCCYEVVSSESLYLGKSSVVRVLIGAIKLLYNEKSLIHQKNLDYDYRVYVLKEEYTTGDFLDEEPHAKVEEFLDSKHHYSGLNMYELVESLIQQFGLNEIKDELAYLQSFQDLILNFCSEQTDELGNFIEWWEEKGKMTSVKMSDSLEAMTVLTIHKSKGLQYPVVIIPFCDWNLDHNTTFDNILWLNSQTAPFDTYSRFPLKYSKDLQSTVYAEAYYREKIKAALDNLNLLYVAYTRAEECLYSFSPLPTPPKGKVSKPFTEIGGLLHAIFTNSDQDYLYQKWVEGETISYLEINKLERKELKTKEPSTQAKELGTYYSSDWREKLSLREKSESVFSLDSENQQAKIDYGVLVHDILSEVKTKDDLDSVLDKYYELGLLDKESKRVVKSAIDKILGHPKVSEWFSGAWEVKTEVPILPNNGIIARLDRVMLKEKKAIVLDYKTGVQSSKDIRQLRAYKKLLRTMGYKEVEAYLLYLENVELLIVD